MLGAIGAGKTSLLLRYLYAIGLRLPWVLHDFIGNGHRHLETWVANLATLLETAERQCPELAGSTTRFLSRFVFGYHGAQESYLRALGKKFGGTVTTVRG